MSLSRRARYIVSLSRRVHYQRLYCVICTTSCTLCIGNISSSADWLCYDDDKVYRLPEVKVQTKDAYILFYVRREKQVQNKL